MPSTDDSSTISDAATPATARRVRREPLRRLPYRDIIALGELAAGGDTSRQRQSERPKRVLTTSWVAILGFASIVAAGALLLRLPAASVSGQAFTWSEAVFTATSAVTVTGLTVLTTGRDFSPFGQAVILVLLQVGGVGFVSISVLLLRLIGRRVTLETRFLVQHSVATNEWSRAWRLAIYVLAVTVAFEAAGAALLWLRWRGELGDAGALWPAIFHAVSSYCNAGFDLFSGTDLPVLFGFATDPATLLVMGALIVIGGFGITVIYDLWSTRAGVRRWSLNTRFTLVMAAGLTAVGALFLWSDNHFHAHLGAQLPGWERGGVALFTIISARTAGMAIIDIGAISEASQALILLWMFIGGAPASMAGGVSTSTVAVLLFSVLAFARGHDAAVAFRRTLPVETIAKAVAIMTVGTLLCAIVTLTLSTRLGFPIFVTAFEVVSAFSNTGYSLGLTPHLDDTSRYLIAFTMFWGRLGPLTIVVALAQSAQPVMVRHPAEPVILG